jgi:hypothetical protein
LDHARRTTHRERAFFGLVGGMPIGTTAVQEG